MQRPTMPPKLAETDNVRHPKRMRTLASFTNDVHYAVHLVPGVLDHAELFEVDVDQGRVCPSTVAVQSLEC